ncbi:MAG TPA: cell wall-binding repeat-containing protein, partial [Acidothermaceae bacterium]|nr:cell wall-binding repeat-containing protein [Acidothermaceae bacterium]
LTRVAGSDRYATGAALFDSAFGTTASVVLTSGANYPDALSAGYLARGLATGILSTDPNVLPAVTAQEIVKHGVQVVYIVGGVGAVSDAVAREVEAIRVGGHASAAPVRVVRIGGSDRYATNNLVDTYSHAQSQTVIIATGEQFADALSVGPAVYVSGYPLVLTPKAGLAVSTKAALSALGAKSAIILGGTSAVSANVEAQLKSLGIVVWTRLAGTDRTQTAAQIATWEVMGIAGTTAYPVGLQTLAFNAGDTPAVGTAVYVVRGDTFADALPAVPVAGHKKNVILMTVDPAAVGTGGPAFLHNPFELDVVHTVQAIGGTSAIADATLAALVQSSGG